MPELPDEIFLGVNSSLFVAAFVLTVIVLMLASRHTWLVGYGAEQYRIRVWMGLTLIILTLIAVSGALFNLFFV